MVERNRRKLAIIKIKKTNGEVMLPSLGSLLFSGLSKAGKRNSVFILLIFIISWKLLLIAVIGQASS